MEGLWTFIKLHPEITIIGAVTLIQIAPIKIDPWTTCAKWLHKMFLGSIEDKIDKLSGKVDRLEAQAEEEKAIQARTHILRFADELYCKKEHQQEYYLQLLDTIMFYEKYCEKHPEFTNGRTIKSCEIIKTTYDSLWGKHKF